MNDDVKLITDYIAVWGWQLMGIIFLTSSFVLFALPATLSGSVFAVAFLLVSAGVFFMSFKRRRELYEDNEEGENESD